MVQTRNNGKVRCCGSWGRASVLWREGVESPGTLPERCSLAGGCAPQYRTQDAEMKDLRTPTHTSGGSAQYPLLMSDDNAPCLQTKRLKP
eukprot:432031-Amphidinium_carterae.1